VLEIHTLLLYVVNTTQLSLDRHSEIQGVSSLKQNPLILAFLRSDLQSHPIFCTSSHGIILRFLTNLQTGRPEKLGFDYWQHQPTKGLTEGGD